MRDLEEMDARDRSDGTPRSQRLRQIPPETGRFIALLAATAQPGRYVEIGTSAGYSTLWLAVACRRVGRTVTTFEVLEDKAALELKQSTGGLFAGLNAGLMIGVDPQHRAIVANCELLFTIMNSSSR